MPVSPKKNVSYVTNSTVNKGVQAREIDIANVRLDTDALSLSRAATESSEWPADTWGYRAGFTGVGEVPGRKDGAMAAGDAPSALTPPLTDQSVSYVQEFGQQVVVQKQRRSGARGPTASSPMRADLGHPTLPIAAIDSSAVPAAVLLACPAFAALHQQPWDKARGLLQAGSCGIQSASAKVSSAADRDTVRQSEINNEKVKNPYFGKKMNCLFTHRADDYDDGPDCMEVYEFDHGCEALVVRGAGPVSYLERGARRASLPAAALLSEMLAVPRLALAAPVHIALQLQRCVLLGVRDAATGVVQTTVDTLLKPLLALAFNAVLRPPLVCLSHSAQAIREALRPFSLAMSDALEPLAKLLAAVRLVQINRQCTCACTHHV